MNKKVTNIRHKKTRRKKIPTVEYQPMMHAQEPAPIKTVRLQRNPDLDPQLVWRGKDQQDQEDLVVSAPPLYIQEKVKPKVLIDDLRRASQENGAPGVTAELFADFNGATGDKTEFYQHDVNWTNRMILGDSLQVMASLAEREDLRGKVQCIYIDPPYGIKFNSNFQWSTTSTEVKDGSVKHITREPEQVKAFRDTWRYKVHSYLSYLRDRLAIARDLLNDTGSCFVQIGDENVHRVRALMDEVFSENNFVGEIVFKTRSTSTSKTLSKLHDYILWYGKDIAALKFHRLYEDKAIDEARFNLADADGKVVRRKDAERNAKYFSSSSLFSTSGGDTSRIPFSFHGSEFVPATSRGWRCSLDGLFRLAHANRIFTQGNSLRYKFFHSDFPFIDGGNLWGNQMSEQDKSYVVQTSPTVIERCILMTTDPGDLVLDPTCGSGTTAYVAEQWGRRWITIDTSRVALALARMRIMGARYPYYLLADTPAGQKKEAEIPGGMPTDAPTGSDIRLGFVYERVPHITLKSIANNAEIDVIYEEHQKTLEPLRDKLNKACKSKWQEWEIPRECNDAWPQVAKKLHAEWWQGRIARQKAIDKSIADSAEFETLYDKPYEVKNIVRVAGPFTMESSSPHRVLSVDEQGNVINHLADEDGEFSGKSDFKQKILDALKIAGVQQTDKKDKINFTSLEAWPGDYICATGTYPEGKSGKEKRAAIFIGPEHGTVSHPDVFAAAKEAGAMDCAALIACAFSYDAQATEIKKLGNLPVLKARMNAELHMTTELKDTGHGNLFVIFGEPDIDIIKVGKDQIRVEIKGVDVFNPNTGEIRSDDPDDIACWFIDTDYNEESFFVRHAYFLGAKDPYKALKTTLKSEINQEAWASLHSATSRPFPKPKTERIAVKVINRFGDEVMRIFRVE